MRNGTSYKIDTNARVWVRSPGMAWRKATADELTRIFLSHPEIAVQVFWVGNHPQHDAVLPLAA